MRLSEMSREQMEAYVDGGQYCDQDVIDLYDDLQRTKGTDETEVSNLTVTLSVETPGLDEAIAKVQQLTQMLEVAKEVEGRLSAGTGEPDSEL